MGKLKKEKEDEKERRTGQQAGKNENGDEKERRTGQKAGKKEEEDEKERRTGQQADKNVVAKTAQVIKLITLAASISVTKAEKKDGEEVEAISLEVIIIYTICVVLFTLAAQKLWNVGVRAAELFLQWCLAKLRSHAEATGDGRSDFSQGEAAESPVSPIVERPAGLGRADQCPQAPPPLPLRDQQALSSTSTPPALHTRNVTTGGIMDDWDEIEKEERRVRADLNSARPGDPILGPVENLPIEEFDELPFKVYTTKYGTVYHSSLGCRYVNAPETGTTRDSAWCSSCRRRATVDRRIPKKGDAMFISSWGAVAHSDPTCERAGKCSTYACCTACF